MEENKGKLLWEKIDNKDCFVISKDLPGTSAQTAGNYGVFFIAYHPCEIMYVVESHTNAASDGSAVTVGLEILRDGDNLDGGDQVLVSDFSLKTAGNIYATKKGLELTRTRQLKPGDRLAIRDQGTLTDLQGLIVTVYMKYLSRGDYR